MNKIQGQELVCSISPTEFEEYCMKILNGYAEKENLKDFNIDHNVKLTASDGIYQIDIYAHFVAMGVVFKVLCECKQYKRPVGRDKVSELQSKILSLGANKGILLSTSGFQSGAIQYAKKHGIALIQVYDYKCEYLSHSANLNEKDDEFDPFLYGERKMPPYVAIECTSEDEYPVKIYPTKKMIRKIYSEMNKLIAKKLGIEFDFSGLEELREEEYRMSNLS